MRVRACVDTTKQVGTRISHLAFRKAKDYQHKQSRAPGRYVDVGKIPPSMPWHHQSIDGEKGIFEIEKRVKLIDTSECIDCIECWEVGLSK